MAIKIASSPKIDGTLNKESEAPITYSTAPIRMLFRPIPSESFEKSSSDTSISVSDINFKAEKNIKKIRAKTTNKAILIPVSEKNSNIPLYSPKRTNKSNTSTSQ